MLAQLTFDFRQIRHIFGSEVGHYAPNTTDSTKKVFVGTLAFPDSTVGLSDPAMLDFLTERNAGFISGFAATTGVAIDNFGQLWSTELSANRAARVNVSAGNITDSGFPLGEIDLRVDLRDGSSPYTYGGSLFAFMRSLFPLTRKYMRQT